MGVYLVILLVLIGLSFVYKIPYLRGGFPYFRHPISCPECNGETRIRYLGLDVGDSQNFSRYCIAPNCSFQLDVEEANHRAGHTNPKYLPAFFEQILVHKETADVRQDKGS